LLKHPFPQKLIDKAVDHCKSVYPEEGCGFILEDAFVPCENVAVDKVKNFKIDLKEFTKYNEDIKAIIHSHADYPHISKHDMISQKNIEIPFGVVFLKNGALDKVAFFGDQIQPYELLERPFIHGIFDCYALMRDYHRLEGHLIKDYPRENLWWETEPSMLEDLCNDAGYDFIDESQVKKGDIIFMKILADVTNHSAVYIGDGLLIHHLYGRLSRREPVVRWKKYITGYLRYFGNDKA
jgi:proteasome lid subunit RPN8/RPN11